MIANDISPLQHSTILKWLDVFIAVSPLGYLVFLQLYLPVPFSKPDNLTCDHQGEKIFKVSEDPQEQEKVELK